MEEIRTLGALEGAEINKAKEVLAYEVTKIVHGEEEAQKAQEAAKTLFSGGIDAENIPSTEMDKERFIEGVDILSLLVETGLTPSKSEGRRLVKQGGISVEEEKTQDFNTIITTSDFKDDKLMIKKGKKIYHQIKLI